MPLDAKLGILAGGGALPARIVDSCIARGRPFFVVAFEGQADADLVAPRDGREIPHCRVRMEKAGATIKRLRRERVAVLVMAGQMRRPALSALRPDLWTMRFLARVGGLGQGDDALLRAIVAALESEGFTVVGADSVVPDLLAPEGILGGIEPDEKARADIRQGIAAALALGARDEGQAAMVRNGRVIGTESADGTDALLASLEAADGPPSGVLVKVAKPGQERRVDLPAIGPQTIEAAKRAGLAGIAVEAGGALVLEREATIAAADAAGLFVLGIAVGPGAGP